MIDSLLVANYFIKKSFSDGTELTPMKLVKLAYIAHGWYLGIKGDPLLTESVQAWKYGPVVHTIYHIFKKYYNSQITSLEHINSSITGEPPIVKDKEITEFLDKIWDVYKVYNGLQLSTMTHKPGTPWDQVWNNGNGKNQKEAPIPNDIIIEYYKAKMEGKVHYA